MAAEPRIAENLEDIQGNTVREYDHGRFPCARFSFFNFSDDNRAARAFLAELAPQVTATAAPDGTSGDAALHTTLNLALTYRGLRELGLARHLLSRFDQAFSEGMDKRGYLLADPDKTEVPAVDLCVGVYGGSERAVDARCEALTGLATKYELREAAPARAAHHLPGGVEHFGFVDGLSQPPIDGLDGVRSAQADSSVRPTDEDPFAGQGVLERDEDAWRRPKTTRDRWRAVRAGEFVFGYKSEGDETPPVSREGNREDKRDAIRDDAQFFDLLRNGTHMVWRQLQQDVWTYREFVRTGSAVLSKSWNIGDADAEAFLGAKMVGRWPDGIPLAFAPTPAQWWRMRAGDPHAMNAFTYADDPGGLKTPLGAHIRRASPRDTAGTRDVDVVPGDLTRRRRIIRRGIPYGPQLPPDALKDDGQERGLIFIALCTDIAGQFEVIQRLWLNHGDFVQQSADRDPLVGSRPAEAREHDFVIPGEHGPVILQRLPDFVTFATGHYFFVPSVHAIHGLADGRYLR